MTCTPALICLLISLTSASVWAHKPSDSYLRIDNDGTQLSMAWDIALKDLEMVVGLDGNRDGKITWGELKERETAITAHALSRLGFAADGRTCEAKLGELRFKRHSDGGYAVLVLDANCPSKFDRLRIDYALLFDQDPTHRGLVSYTMNGSTTTHVLRPDAPTAYLQAGAVSLWRVFVSYLREGVRHILIGFDHILFLLSLLLPTVLYRQDGRWRPVRSLGPSAIAILKIVTVFTIAHSMTLWLAVMGYVALPGRLIESVIAFSILVTALNNLFPVLPLSGWMIAFGFGLVHGFGFANVLTDLGLADRALGISLFGFNVGVEAGQLAIVLLFMPFAFVVRDTTFYRLAILRMGSIAIALIAVIWMLERLLVVEIV